VPAGAALDPGDLDLRAAIAPADAAKESFLMAATRQINAHGYRGASVDRISAALNLHQGRVLSSPTRRRMSWSPPASAVASALRARRSAASQTCRGRSCNVLRLRSRG